MSIEIDWQIVDHDVPQPSETRPVRPRRPGNWRKWLVVSGAILTLALGAAAGYVTMTYRTQLARAEGAVRPIARQEAQAVAAHDRASFLALQDPGDRAWRAMQDKRFGVLENNGLPEFGWEAAGLVPEPGSVSLEPGGARLDVTYRFSITHPLPGGPTSITLRVPQFYKPTPSGWVHAWPVTEFWGRWQQRPGRRVSVIYLRRDAPVIEPLIPRLDTMADQLCATLACPPFMGLLFENLPESATYLSDFSYGFDEGITVKLPSPHLIGVPTDAASRDEYYRAVGTRVVQALVVEASGRRLNLYYLAHQEILRWELAQAGLTGPFFNEAITRTLKTAPASARQPLGTISLRTVARGLDAAPGEVVMPLAFDFLERQFGSGTVARMATAITSNRLNTLGEAISATLRVNPTTLELAWQKYLREREGTLSATRLLASLPAGEMVLSCPADLADTYYSILRLRTDGAKIQTVEDRFQNPPLPAWSPDGKKLAYIREGRVVVMDADTQQIKTVATDHPVDWFDWLSEDHMHLRSEERGVLTDYVMDLDTGQEAQITGTQHNWSPDGTQVAYLVTPGPGNENRFNIWIADANGDHARQIARGVRPTWSPADGHSKRLAFWGRVSLAPSSPGGTPYASEIRMADMASDSITTLARVRDLVTSQAEDNQGSRVSDLTWSPDGSMLAALLYRSNETVLSIVRSDTGAMRARWQEPRASWGSVAWSSDNRHLALSLSPDPPARSTYTVDILDVLTGQSVTLPGNKWGGFDWSPDGQWLAIVQEPSGVLLVTPDLDSRWLDTPGWLDAPGCYSVAWRPANYPSRLP